MVQRSLEITRAPTTSKKSHSQSYTYTKLDKAWDTARYSKSMPG